MAFLRSSYSAEHGECVEVANLGDDTVASRDSKHHTTGPIPTTTSTGWQTFITAVTTGQLDPR